MDLNEIILHEILGEYFDNQLSKEDKRGMSRYMGRNVIWYGAPEQMIVVPKEDVHGMWGNIYDNEKLNHVKNMILDSEEPVEFTCSYGVGDVVEFINIQEHQESSVSGRFETDYDGHERPYSTGDPKLDEYIGTQNPADQDFTEFSVSNDDILQFFNNHKYDLLGHLNDKEELWKEFQQLAPDEDEVNAFEEFITLEEDLVEAFNNNTGDIGKFSVQLRDGHHRVMGAIAAGEDFICLNLQKDQVPKFSEYINRV